MHDGSYCTYIMASRSRTIYIGVTGNLHQRVFEHKWNERDGFTAGYNCDRLVWFENFQYIQKAIAREKELKGWRRALDCGVSQPLGQDYGSRLDRGQEVRRQRSLR